MVAMPVFARALYTVDLPEALRQNQTATPMPLVDFNFHLPSGARLAILEGANHNNGKKVKKFEK